jgi:hypothetical protein
VKTFYEKLYVLIAGQVGAGDLKNNVVLRLDAPGMIFTMH